PRRRRRRVRRAGGASAGVAGGRGRTGERAAGHAAGRSALSPPGLRADRPVAGARPGDRAPARALPRAPPPALHLRAAGGAGRDRHAAGGRRRTRPAVPHSIPRAARPGARAAVTASRVLRRQRMEDGAVRRARAAGRRRGGDGAGHRGAARRHHGHPARAARHGRSRRQSRDPRGRTPVTRRPRATKRPAVTKRPAAPRRRPPLVPDPVTREIIRGALRAAQTHMEAVIERTAMSPFIREKNDYFAGILDARGRVVCGTMVPLFGNLTQIIFEQYPAETMRPGDLYWYNDCHGSHGGVSHSPDMVFAAPVFHRCRLVAFSQTWVHFWDIG